MYEVDNRYPEVAEPYEKIRGVKHHSGLRGGRELYAVRKAVRANNLKRGFWTSAAAVVLVLILLIVSPGGKQEPGAFRAPEIRIVSAVQSPEAADLIQYSYYLELNSADSADVIINARTKDGVLLGSAGPFRHLQSEGSELLQLRLSAAAGLSEILLEADCRYQYEGEDRSLQDSRHVSLRGGTPPDTEPVTEPTEPVTEPSESDTPTEPFAAPTLRISDASLNGTEPTPLSYRYLVTLNDAEQMEVTAQVFAGSGESLGSEGPFTHTESGNSPEHSLPLSWISRPDSLTLTLTGTYTENGVTKTVESSQTLNVPEIPFTAPTLQLEEAALNGSNVTPLRYRYRVALNSAQDLEVRVSAISGTGAELGSAGAYSHSSSGLSPARSLPLSWTVRPETVTLILTGTYTERGQARTVTLTQSLNVPAEPFTAPTLAITGASLNGSDVTPLSFRYRVTLNSAQSMQVRASVRADNGANLGSSGSYSHVSSGTSPTRSIPLSWTARPASVTLTLTGSYTENGQGKTVTATQTLAVSDAPFTAPTLSITNASLNGSSVTPLSYRYQVTLNSAQSMQVRASVSSQAGANLGSAGPYNHTASGSSPARSLALSWTTRPSTVTLTLTGSYTENGSTKTVTAAQTLTVPAEPFTAPTLRIVSASLNGSDVTPLSCSYQVTLNSAQSMQVRASVSSQAGANLGSAGPYSHSASGTSPTRSIPLSWTTRPTSVTLTLTGTYTENGSTKTVTATQTLPVPAEPFTPPTLRIVSASLNGSDVTPLSCSYQVTLNSAASLQVSAEVRSEAGLSLGSAGAFSHSSSGVSPSRSIPLSWTTRPSAVTLTLTGTYTENGQNKTVTATQTLTVPDPPFTDPTLEIVNARIVMPDIALSYNYKLELNDAALLDVSAELGYDEEDALGNTEHKTYVEDGPISHSSSETTKLRNVPITAYTETSEPVYLTLTGTYQTSSGETKTLTVRQEVEYWSTPEIYLDEATRPGPDLDDVVYSGVVFIGSVDSLELKVELLNEDEELLASDGPYTLTDYSPINDWSIHADGSRGLNLILRLTGTYVAAEGEDPQTVTASLPLDAMAPFEAPEIILNSAERSGTEVRYEYELTMNSVSEMTVTASFYDAADNLLFTDAPVTRTGGGTFTVSATDASLDQAARIVLTGDYEYYGTPGSVSDELMISASAPFQAPSFVGLRAELNGFDAFSDPITLDVSARVNIGDANPLRVNITVVSDLGTQVGQAGPIEFSDSGAISETVSLNLTGAETSLTVTVTGVYDENGTERTISENVTVLITMNPEGIDSGGEAYINSDDSVTVEYWAEFGAMPGDPHAEAYSFTVDQLIVFWYNGDTLLSSADASDQSLTITKPGIGSYSFEGTLVLPYPGSADQLTIQLNITDSSTGKTYTTTTNKIPLE